MRPREWINRLLGRPTGQYLHCKSCGAGISRLHMLSGREDRKRGVKMLVLCKDCNIIWTVRGKDMDVRAAFLQLLNQARAPYRTTGPKKENPCSSLLP